MDDVVTMLPKLRTMAYRFAWAWECPSLAQDLAQEGAVAVLTLSPPWHEGEAVVAARRAMSKVWRSTFPVSVSPKTLQRLSTVRRTTEELWRRLGRYPSDTEVGAKLRMHASTVLAYRCAFDGEPVSLFTVGDDGETQERVAEPGPSPEAALREKELQRDVARAVSGLTPEQAEAVVQRFGLGDGEAVQRSSVPAAIQAATPILARALHAWAPQGVRHARI